MADFNPIEGRLTLVNNGVYKPADLFEKNGQIFAKAGTGFIAIKANGSTSKNKVFWDDLDIVPETKNRIGNLVLVNQLAIAAE